MTALHFFVSNFRGDCGRKSERIRQLIRPSKHRPAYRENNAKEACPRENRARGQSCPQPFGGKNKFEQEERARKAVDYHGQPSPPRPAIERQVERLGRISPAGPFRTRLEVPRPLSKDLIRPAVDARRVGARACTGAQGSKWERLTR